MCSIWLVLVLRIEMQANSKGIKLPKNESYYSLY